MVKIIAAFGISLTLLTSAFGAGRTNAYEWGKSPVVKADLNGSGQLDSAQLGLSKDSVGLLIKIDGKRQPLIELSFDGSKQFAICPGGKPKIRAIAQSEAPLNALGEYPEGYAGSRKFFEIVLSDGECDPVHFYWNERKKQISWWRA